MTEDEWEEVRHVQMTVIRGPNGNNHINVRVPSWLFDKIIQQAKRRDRSVAAMVHLLLKEAIASRDVARRDAA